MRFGDGRRTGAPRQPGLREAEADESYGDLRRGRPEEVLANPEARKYYWSLMNDGLFKLGIDAWWLAPAARRRAPRPSPSP